MEVKLGKPRLEDVGMTGIGMAWEGPLGPGMEESSEHQEEWIDIVVGVELEPWPDSNWLTFWREEDLQWPKHLEEPLLDGRKLIFTAPEDNLEEAWSAVNARVEGANRLYREEYPPEEKHAPDAEEQEALARLREAAQRRIDALEIGLVAPHNRDEPAHDGQEELARGALAVVERGWHCESLRPRFPASPSGSPCFAASPLAPADQRRTAKGPCRSHNPSS